MKQGDTHIVSHTSQSVKVPRCLLVPITRKEQLTSFVLCLEQRQDTLYNTGKVYIYYVEMSSLDLVHINFQVSVCWPFFFLQFVIFREKV